MLCIIFINNASWAQDPGVPDSVIIGNLDGSHIQASPGDTISIQVWVKNDEDLAVIFLPMATANQYISERLGGNIYDLLLFWDLAEFLDAAGNEPIEGFTTQALVGVCEIYSPYVDSVFNSEGNWVMIAEFALEISSDTANIGHSTQTIEGYSPPAGPPEFADPTGQNSWIPVIVGGYIDIVASGCDYVPGDITGNGLVQGSDVTYGVNYFRGTGPRRPIPAGTIQRKAGFIPPAIATAIVSSPALMSPTSTAT